MSYIHPTSTGVSSMKVFCNEKCCQNFCQRTVSIAENIGNFANNFAKNIGILIHYNQFKWI